MAVMKPVIRELTLEALGDDFVQLSGEWIENARVVDHAKQAGRIWAFVAESPEAVSALMDGLTTGQGERIVGLSPGMHPDWQAEDRAVCLRLAGVVELSEGLTGLLMAVEAPICTCPHRETGCPEGCEGCGK